MTVKEDSPKPKKIEPHQIPSKVANQIFKDGAYLERLAMTLQDIAVNQSPQLEQIVDKLYETWRVGGRVFTLGNGGSSANASQIAADMAKRTRVDGMPFMDTSALTDSVEGMTAYANDEGYERVFVGQLECKSPGPNDTVIALSGSGNSPNVLTAVQYAKAQGVTTIGLSGFEGGQLSDLADITLVVPQQHLTTLNPQDPHGPVMAGAEDVHMAIFHGVFEALRERIELAKEQIVFQAPL